MLSECMAKNRTKTGQFTPGQSGNPHGRPRLDATKALEPLPSTIEHTRHPDIRDGWENVITNVGTAKDNRSGGRFRLAPVSSVQARNLWRGSDLGARIVETHASEALRRGIELRLEDGQKEESEEILAALEQIPGPAHVGNGAIATFIKAMQYEAAYGGAAIWPVINDSSGSLELPLEEGRIVSVERLALFEPRELRPERYYIDPLHPKFGEPEMYRIWPLAAGVAVASTVLIHESRLIIFPGIRVTREQLTGVEVGWGDNKFTRCLQVLSDFDLSFGGAATLLAQFSQLVIKLKGLAEVQGTNEDFKTHLKAMDTARSILNALVVDADDDVSRLAVSMSGFPETLDKIALRLAAAADMPVSLLLGQAPAGLNATGDSDIRFFYDRVSQLQNRIRPMLERLIRWMLLSVEGPTGGTEPDTWCVEFPPLWQPNESEKIATRKVQMEIDVGYIAAQVYSPEEAAAARFGGDSYSFETQLDFDLRDKFALAAPLPVAKEGEDPAAAPVLPAIGAPIDHAAPAAAPTEPATPAAPEPNA